MESLMEILKIISPPLVTGIITFIITKYTYSKNRPLDKLEITYNRVYYPIYRVVHKIDVKKVNVQDIDLVIKQCKQYFKKYDKYVDLSTAKAFNTLCQSDSAKKKAYIKFQDNIKDKSSYLRQRLGYLEPNFFQIYKYLPNSDQSSIRICIEFCLIYFFIFLYSIPVDWLQSFSVLAFLICLVVIVVEAIIKGIKGIYQIVQLLWNLLCKLKKVFQDY